MRIGLCAIMLMLLMATSRTAHPQEVGEVTAPGIVTPQAVYLVSADGGVAGLMSTSDGFPSRPVSVGGTVPTLAIGLTSIAGSIDLKGLVSISDGFPSRPVSIVGTVTTTSTPNALQSVTTGHPMTGLLVNTGLVSITTGHGNSGLLVSMRPDWLPTFTVVADSLVNSLYGVPPSFPLVILNRNTDKVVRIWQVNFYVDSTAALAGVLLRVHFVRGHLFAALPGGTAITPIPMDTTDIFPSNIDIAANPTITQLTDQVAVKKAMLSADESVVATSDADAYASQQAPRDGNAVIARAIRFLKPITLRSGVNNEGFAVSNQGAASPAQNITTEMTITVSND